MVRSAFDPVYRRLGASRSIPVVEDSDGSATTDRVEFYPAHYAKVDVDNSFLVDAACLDGFGVFKRGVACCESDHSYGETKVVFNLLL